MRSSLRSFFRFLRVEGFCGDVLEAALPTVAHWRLATLPRSLTEQQVKQVLASFDVSTPCGQWDQVIVQCLSTLGLRPGEVADLCLDDIDWRGGTLQIRARKKPSRRRAAAAPRGGAGAGRLSEQGASGDRRTPGLRRAPGKIVAASRSQALPFRRNRHWRLPPRPCSRSTVAPSPPTLDVVNVRAPSRLSPVRYVTVRNSSWR